MIASLDEFMKSGRLGPLTVGMSRDAVADHLGAPEATSIQKNPLIWKYGPVELSFQGVSEESDPSLTSITWYLRDGAALPEALRLEGWLPTPGTTFEEFRDHLKGAGIAISGGVATGPRQHLVLESALRVTFEEGKVSNLSLASKREPKSKQFSISVPSEHYEAIAREARSRGISVPALCSSWVVDQAVKARGARVS
jgi:hypothetical protein